MEFTGILIVAYAKENVTTGITFVALARFSLKNMVEKVLCFLAICTFKGKKFNEITLRRINSKHFKKQISTH